MTRVERRGEERRGEERREEERRGEEERQKKHLSTQHSFQSDRHHSVTKGGLSQASKHWPRAARPVLACLAEVNLTVASNH